MGASFKNGLAIAAIIHRYRPDLIDFHSLKAGDDVANNQLAFDILEKELGISPVRQPNLETELFGIKFIKFTRLRDVVSRGEIPKINLKKDSMQTKSITYRVVSIRNMMEFK